MMENILFWLFFIIILLLLIVVFILLYKFRYLFGMIIKNKKILRKQQEFIKKKNLALEDKKIQFEKIIENLGGLNNLKEVRCISIRVKIIVNDASLINRELLNKNPFISGFIIKNNICNIIIGEDAGELCNYILEAKNG